MRNLQALLLILICFSVLPVAVACQQPSIHDSFKIYLFAEKNPHIPSTVNWGDEEGWKALVDIDLSQNDLVLDEDGIISYDWASQEILFESTLREQMKRKFDFSGYFVVTLGDIPITGGVALRRISAAAPRLPLMYYNDFLLESETDELKLQLRPYKAADNSPYDIIYSGMSDRVKQRMRDIGKLTE